MNELRVALDYSLSVIRRNMKNLKQFPHTTSRGRWLQSEHGRWTAGFWIGEIWLAYLYTNETEFFEQAHHWLRRLEFRKYDRTTHDMGFLFQPSFVRGWKISNDLNFRDIALTACSSHASRFNVAGGFIPAWDSSEDPKFSGRTIVDTVMNLPILCWGAKETGREDWAEIVKAVAKTIMTHHVREDGSTYHVVDFNPLDGRVTSYTTHQGYAANSCWSRGQAWAMYGFTQLYNATGRKEYLTTAKDLATYFLKHLPDDSIPYWDFDAPSVPYEPKDSAAASIASSALLELDRALGGGSSFRNAGIEIVTQLALHCLSEGREGQEGILLHGAVDVPRSSAVDESIIYGDHYFIESLLKILLPELWDFI